MTSCLLQVENIHGTGAVPLIWLCCWSSLVRPSVLILFFCLFVFVVVVCCLLLFLFSVFVLFFSGVPVVSVLILILFVR